MDHNRTSNNKLNFKYFVIYGMVYEFILRLYKPYQVKFLERLGGDEFHISLLNSLPGLIMVFTVLPAIFYLRHLDSRKMTGSMLLLSRFFVLLFATVPFMPKEYQPMAFIVIAALLSAPTSLYVNSFQTLTGELFSPKDRPHALGLKSRYGVIVTIIVIFATGQILSKLPSTEGDRIILYQLFFVLAFILTFIELIILSKLKPLESTVNSTAKPSVVFKEIFSNKPYLIFVACSLLFHFGWQMGWPLYSIYTIKELGADESWLSLISISSMCVMLIGHTIWPKLINKFGNPVIISICTVGMAITPLLYIASKDLITLTIMAAFTGIFTSGTLTVLLSSILEVIPTQNRIIYMGVYTTFTNITLAIAPIIGHYFLSSRSIQFALLMTTIFRLIGGVAFIIRNHYIKRNKALMSS